jgi:hypothetical protein
MSFTIPYAPQERLQQPNRISELLLRAAEAQAEGQRRGGAIWGGALSNLGQTIGNTISDMQEQKARAPIVAAELADRKNRAEASKLTVENSKREQSRQARREAAMAMPNRQEAIAALASDPTGQSELIKSFESLDKYRDGIFGEVGYQLKRSNFNPQAVQFAAKEMEAQGWDPQKIQAMVSNPEALVGQVDEWLMNSPNAKHQALVMPKAPIKLSPGESIVDPTTFKPLATNAKPEEQVFVTRGGRVVPIAKGTAQPGDVPYEKPNAPGEVSYSPKLIMVGGKEIQANYNSKTGKYHDPETGAVLSGVQSPPTAEMRNKGIARNLVKKSLASMKTLSEKVITNIGPSQRAKALKEGAEAVFGMDPTFRTYQDARYALAGNLAVNQQGSRPSDSDIKTIWLPMVPDPYRDTSESAQMKWDLINQMSMEDGPKEEAAPSPLAVTAPDGKVYTFPNKAQADAFKKRAGIN